MAATDRQEATARVQDYGLEPGPPNAVLRGWEGTAD